LHFGSLLDIMHKVTTKAGFSGGGGYWYFSHSQESRATINIPQGQGQGQVTINLFTDAGLSQQQIDSMLQAGDLQGYIVLSGPFDFKFLGLRMAVTLPLKQILGGAGVGPR